MTAKQYQERLYSIIKTMERPGINEFDRGYIQGLTFALLLYPDHFDKPVNKEFFDFNNIKTNYIVKHKEHGYGTIEVITVKNEKPSSFLVHYENGKHISYHKEDIHDFDKIGPWEGDEIQ